MTKGFLWAVGAGAAVILGCGSSGGGGGGGGTCTASSAIMATAISATDYTFTPSCAKVNAGMAVTWTNNGNASHTVTSDAGLFNSGTINTGAAFTFTFTTPGTYTYHCAFHQSRGMTGTVIVQ